MSRYEGDFVICQKCDHYHKLHDKLIDFCEKCGHDMRLKFSEEEEKALLNHLDLTYKKARIDDLQ